MSLFIDQLLTFSVIQAAPIADSVSSFFMFFCAVFLLVALIFRVMECLNKRRAIQIESQHYDHVMKGSICSLL